MTQTLKSKKGVTLVELLAVIVILGIIAAIAVPAIGGLITRQQENAANASYTAVTEASKTYALSESDNDFTMADLVSLNYIDSNPFDLAYTGVTITAADIDITVSGSTVTISCPELTAASLDLTIDGFDVTN